MPFRQCHIPHAGTCTRSTANPPSLYADYLKTHGEGVQHLGVPVDNLERSIAEFQKLGYTVAQSGAWGETGKKGSGRYA